jgi:hypothetical protein
MATLPSAILMQWFADNYKNKNSMLNYIEGRLIRRMGSIVINTFYEITENEVFGWIP